MQSINSIVLKLKNSYPKINFKTGSDFCWSADDNTVFYMEDPTVHPGLLLHELAHALLNHHNYKMDIELVSMERQAWDLAIELSKKYKIIIPDDLMQDHLDTYRDWMHLRSKCINCQATGVQKSNKTYQCPVCSSLWQANEARFCSLRRYKK